ncbi:MAG: hypothetical protein RL367_530 [Pseudomonadota bacterium]
MTRCDLPLPLVGRGKVRDIFQLGDHLLIVATDRISAFDVVMDEPVPGKGTVLTQLSAWWFGKLGNVIENHLVSANIDDIIAAEPALRPYRRMLDGRAMLCKRASVVPFECVVRGYLAGSAWAEYSQAGTLAGEPLPPGLIQSARLPDPLFSPATKAETGHDENIAIAEMVARLGPALTDKLAQASLALYAAGSAIAAQHGLIVADTKFEFGVQPDGSIMLIDEALTPDSSRYWPANAWRAGEVPPSYDKQPLRDYLSGERKAGRWNGEAPPPPLPGDVITATTERYRELYLRLVGRDIETPDFAAD